MLVLAPAISLYGCLCGYLFLSLALVYELLVNYIYRACCCFLYYIIIINLFIINCYYFQQLVSLDENTFFYISKFMAGNNQTKVVLIGTDSWDRADWNGQLGRDERERYWSTGG